MKKDKQANKPNKGQLKPLLLWEMIDGSILAANPLVNTYPKSIMDGH